MAKKFDPTRFAFAGAGRKDEAVTLVNELVDKIDEIEDWSETAGKFVNEMIERLALDHRNTVVTEKQLNWMKKLKKQFIDEDKRSSLGDDLWKYTR